MRIQKTKQTGIFTTTRNALFMATFAIAFSVTPALQSPARADGCVEVQNIVCGMRKNVVRARNAGPIGITTSNIEEDAGMYHDRGKSSPKIAHGRAPDRNDSWTDWLFRMLGY